MTKQSNNPPICFPKIFLYGILTLGFMYISYFTKEFVKYLIYTSETGIVNYNLLSLVKVKNTGAAFSILSSHNALLISFASFAMWIMIIMVIKKSNTLSFKAILGFSLLTAGVAMNLYERCMNGYVFDYIKLRFIDFPVFNVSDILITTGAILLSWILLRNKNA